MSAAILLLQGYGLHYFCGRFFAKRLSSGLCTGAAVAMIYAGGRWSIAAADEAITLTLLLQALLLGVIVKCFYQGNGLRLVVVIVQFLTVSELSFWLAYGLTLSNVPIIEAELWLLERGYLSMVSFMWLLPKTAQVLLALMYGASIVILLLTLRKIGGALGESLDKTESGFLLAPAILGLAIGILLRSFVMMAQENATQLWYQQYPLLMLVVPLMLVLTLETIFRRIDTIQKLHELTDEKARCAFLEQQIVGLQAHISEILRSQAGLRRMKHDLRNTLAIMGRLLNSERMAALPDYLTALAHDLNEQELAYQTGDSVADALLSMAAQTLPNVRLDSDALIFPDGFAVASYDLGILLGNGLDNAVEACQQVADEGAFIRLKTFQRGQGFFLEISNPFCGELPPLKKDGLPESSKADHEAHGMGLANIRRTAEKYDGTAEWFVDENIFTLSIMLKIPRSEENVRE